MTRHLPRVMGHEFAGVVAAVGEGTSAVREGDRVVVQSVIGCGACKWCDEGLANLCVTRRTFGIDVDGGFAELAAVPARNVYRLPDGVSFEAGALLQPFAIATYAVERAQVRPGERIGVWGAGQIGLSIIQLAQQAGARVEVAVGRSSVRLDAASALGAAHVVSALDGDPGAALAERFAHEKLDVVFEASGSVRGATSALGVLGKRGRLVLIGNLAAPFHADLLPAIFKEISIVSVHTYSLGAWRRALANVGRIEAQRADLPLVVLPLAQGEQAFERAAGGEGAKFLLQP